MKTRLLLLAATLSTLAAWCGDVSKKQWEAMDYGPFLSMTLNLGTKLNGSDNSVLKATVIKLGDKDHPAYIAYDTDTMRVAAVWKDGFIDWKGTIFNGNHHAQPHPAGTILFSTHNGPGWGIDGKFDDPRANQTGPMPKELIHYKGLYRSGNSVVLSYSVGDCNILETPSLDWRGGIVREFNLSPCAKPLSLVVLDHDENPSFTNKEPANATFFSATDATHKWQGHSVFRDTKAEFRNDKGRISVYVPAHDHPIKIKFWILTNPGHTDGNGAVQFAKDLSPLMQGGPALWQETIPTQGILGKEDGPYAIDTLTIPEKNPWNSWMRIGGFDFFADGKRAALCTWSGDVWIVSGIDDALGNLTWKRFASGLYQPLGLKIVDEKIYCTCRDQIVKLHDVNGDGEADFYENFNNDFILSYHFHEFMMDLQTDAEGNFYFAKGGTPGVGGPNFDVVTPHNGCFFKLSKDGTKLDIVARGLRAPNGIGVGPHGELTSGDNEGSWVPVCPINEVKQDGFIGVVPESWPGQPVPVKRDPPICWIPWHVDNSAGCQVWVTSKKWGPFENEMLHLSYGKSSLFHVLTERVDGILQGGVAKLPLQFASGINRARFNPVDGQLYVTGLKGWQTTAARDGVFQRVRYTGKAVNLPAALHTTPTGVTVTFTAALNKESAEDLGNYAAWWFNVIWRKEYGSDRWSPTNPTKKWEKGASNPPGESLAITSATLLPDGKTVRLEMPGFKPVTNMVLDVKLKAADGTTIQQEICNTIHALPK
ncbi:MAG: DUF6797 domain-containing protein [Planctomycetota bacterium]